MTEIQRIKKMLLTLAVFYGFDMTDQQLVLWSEWLAARITPDECSEAMRLYCENPQNEFFPRPIGKLVALARPQLSDEDVGRDVAARIIGAVRKHGRMDWAGAQLTIGEIGVIAVGRLGGWSMICDLSNVDNLTTLQAQLRDLVKSVSAQAKAGIVDRPPALPGKENLKLQGSRSVAALITDLSTKKTV